MTLSMWTAAWCGLTALGWLGAWRKTRAEVRTNPYRLRPAPEAPPLGQELVVVIPARNEAANIRSCVEAVLADPDPLLRVVVVDDDSSDATPRILSELSQQDARLEVVSGAADDARADWLGKPRACQRGGEAAMALNPELILFLDADVQVAAGALRGAAGWLKEHDLDLLSVMGSLELRSFWERAIQPAVVGLILAGNDLARINDPARRPKKPLANGQFMLFRARAWEQNGGHGAVARSIIDDVGLATATVQAGGTYNLLFGPRIFRCRMYTGLSEIWSGWSKNLFEGMGASWSLVGGLVLFVALSVVLPWVAVPVAVMCREPFLAVAALSAIAGMVAARVQLDRRFGQDPRYAVTIPLGWTVLAAIAVASGIQFHRGGGTWKGRALPARGR